MCVGGISMKHTTARKVAITKLKEKFNELYTLYVNTIEFYYIWDMGTRKILRGKGRRYTSTLNTTDLRFQFQTIERKENEEYKKIAMKVNYVNNWVLFNAAINFLFSNIFFNVAINF